MFVCKRWRYYKRYLDTAVYTKSFFCTAVDARNKSRRRISWSYENRFYNATTRDGDFYLVCERCGAEEKQTLTADPATCPLVVRQRQKRSQSFRKKANHLSRQDSTIGEKKDDTQPSTDKKNDTKPAKEVAKVGTRFVVAGQSYKVTKAGKEVSFISAKKNAKNISVPATVKSKGITYKVTSIAAKAVKNNKKVKSVIVGANVKKIANKAFFKCPNLKKITIKSVKLTKKTFSKKAFKGLHKKLVVKVPKKVKKACGFRESFIR